MILVESRDLLDGFRRGDKAALLQVYRHFVTDVSRFLTRGFTFESRGRPCAFRGFRGGYEIEAALQEVFRRSFEERARLAYDGIKPYRPYLLRIARNMVINDLKAKNPILFKFRAGRPVILEPTGELEPDETTAQNASPEEVLEAQEVAKLVATFKENLDERGRGVFACRFEEGLSAERAGKNLNLTRSQIRTTETKLKKQFLDHMKRSGYLEGYGGDSAKTEQLATAILLLISWGAT